MEAFLTKLNNYAFFALSVANECTSGEREAFQPHGSYPELWNRF
jgi:hypothetical protein